MVLNRVKPIGQEVISPIEDIGERHTGHIYVLNSIVWD